jgi:hypothetical protein
MKPAPDVCTVSIEDTTLLALTWDGEVSEIDLADVMEASQR